jgi:chaperonin cofactor prefoldin
MKTTIPKLRQMIRKVIVESMSPSDPDYESVGEVIMQVNRKIMFGQIADEASLREECELLAGDYQVYQHVDYIFEKCLNMMRQMGM